MHRKDFAVVAQILADIEDPWAQGQAINRACFRLGAAYPRFDASKFRKHIQKLEANG